jgi:hypothetical protein
VYTGTASLELLILGNLLLDVRPEGERIALELGDFLLPTEGSENENEEKSW